MKTLAFGAVFLGGLLIGGGLAHWHGSAERGRAVAQLLAQFDADRSALEAELARSDVGQHPPVIAAPAAASPILKSEPGARDLLNALVVLRPASGTDQAGTMRRALGLLEQLARIGPAAVPDILQVLISGQDVSYGAQPRSARDIKSLLRSLTPYSLRLGLIDVLRQIGGPEAEQALATVLTRTPQGLEVACLTDVLEELAPGKYRDSALATACSMLQSGMGITEQDREFLFAVLQRFGDTSFVATAQAQLLQPGGKLDRSALKYLQQSMGETSLALAAQYYRDSRLAEPGSKEPLARLALNFVGANAEAAQLYHTAIMDASLLPDQKRELIEDLNQDGISSGRNPTPQDLKVIRERYALTQAYLQQDYVLADRLLTDAFREADKDLRNMLQRASATAQATQAP